MESKRDRFKRLASHRTNEVLHRLKVLGNCSNRQLYDYDEKDIEKIFAEVERKLKEIKSKFQFSGKKGDKFRL